MFWLMYTLYPNNKDYRRSIRLNDGENVIGRGMGCRISYPSSGSTTRFLHQRSLQCSRKQAVITIESRVRKGDSILGRVMKDQEVIGM